MLFVYFGRTQFCVYHFIRDDRFFFNTFRKGNLLNDILTANGSKLATFLPYLTGLPTDIHSRFYSNAKSLLALAHNAVDFFFILVPGIIFRPPIFLFFCPQFFPCKTLLLLSQLKLCCSMLLLFLLSYWFMLIKRSE